jgi:glucoamylase
MLHWSSDRWHTVNDTRSNSTAIGIDFVDLESSQTMVGPIFFTFLWVDEDRWEGIDYRVEVKNNDGKGER